MEQEMTALCLKHGLRMFSIAVWPERELRFSAYAHPDLEACGLGNGKTVAEALEAAMADLHSKKAA